MMMINNSNKKKMNVLLFGIACALAVLGGGRNLASAQPLISQIETPLREHGYQHLQTGVIGSESSFNSWIEEIRTQDYWNSKDSILNTLQTSSIDFNKYNLVVYSWMESSGGIQIDIDTPIVTSKDDKTKAAVITIHRDVPDFGTSDVAYYSIFYVVDSSEVSEIYFDTRDVLDIAGVAEENKGFEPPDASVWKKQQQGTIAAKSMVYQIPAVFTSVEYKDIESKYVISTQDEFDIWFTTLQKDEFSKEFIELWTNERQYLDFTTNNLVIYRFYEGSAINELANDGRAMLSSSDVGEQAAIITINRELVNVRTSAYYALFYQINKSITKVYYDKRITVVNDVSSNNGDEDDGRVFEVDADRDDFNDSSREDRGGDANGSTTSAATATRSFKVAVASVVIVASAFGVIMSQAF